MPRFRIVRVTMPCNHATRDNEGELPAEESLNTEPSSSHTPALKPTDSVEIQFTKQAQRTRWAMPLVTRLHFYIGILLGPLLLIAALSGMVYALTPQIEDAIYRTALFTDSTGGNLPLHAQISAAQASIGNTTTPFAVRPATEPGTTTRVMFVGPDMGPSESRAIFVDPVTGEIRGDLGVYGTSGVLPVRSWLDQFHRGLKLGDVGRLYSELAASWLWLLALGGLAQWFARRRNRRLLAKTDQNVAIKRHRLRDWHGTLGVVALLGILFFSVTGLTWSQYAGANIGVLRAHYGWGTPSVSTDLPDMPTAHAGEAAHGSSDDAHAHHLPVPAVLHADPVMFDNVLQAARTAGIDSDKVEIRPPSKAGKAWTVTEVDRSWPTNVDAVSVDPRTLAIVDQTRFDDFPLAAKLTRWGIDAHMGTLFGLPNQLILIAAAACLTTLIVWGYMMWWRRRPTKMHARTPAPSLFSLLRNTPKLAVGAIAITAALVGYFLPLLGISLVALLLWDGMLHYLGQQRR